MKLLPKFAGECGLYENYITKDELIVLCTELRYKGSGGPLQKKYPSSIIGGTRKPILLLL